MVMGSCDIRFRKKQDYHVLSPLPPFLSKPVSGN
jgi:hypothetical protein